MSRNFDLLTIREALLLARNLPPGSPGREACARHVPFLLHEVDRLDALAVELARLWLDQAHFAVEQLPPAQQGQAIEEACRFYGEMLHLIHDQSRRILPPLPPCFSKED